MKKLKSLRIATSSVSRMQERRSIESKGVATMNIRKHWKKILLSSAALFWASCGGDSENSPVLPNNNGSETPSSSSVATPTSSVGITESSSSEISSADGCSENCGTPLSSAEESSSSSALSSGISREQMPYRLASDTSVACYRHYIGAGGKCLDPVHVADSPAEIMRKLKENQTLSLEELSELEDDLLGEQIDVPLYGTSFYTCTHIEMKSTYACTDGNMYESLEGDPKYVVKDNLLYSIEEYEEKFPKSSSSSEISSSSEPPSPLCQKSDFVDSPGLRQEFENDKDAIIDSVKATEGVSEEKVKCLKSIYATRYLSDFSGYIAKTQTCDGDTIVNPRYQAKLDSNKVYIQEQIDECLKDKQ